MASKVSSPAPNATKAQETRQNLDLIRQQIQEAQSRCRVLEEELAVQNRHVGNIQALPAEILSIIFEIYLEYNPSLIRRLMLVCRQWYHVSINNPRFWTSIKIYAWRYESNYKYGVSCLKPYLDACFKYCGAALLHIDLDFSAFVSWDRHVENQLTSTLMTLFPDIDENAIGDWLISQDWSWCKQDGDETPGHYIHLLDLLDHLGPTSRWASLNVYLPGEEEVAREVLEKLAGAAPALLSLSIIGDERQEVMDDMSSIVFRGLTSITTLKTPDIRMVDTISLASSLQSLDIATKLEDETIAILNTLNCLHTLKISSSDSELTPTPGTLALSLPKLQNIHFIGLCERIGWPRFSFPALRNLIFARQYREFFNDLPHLEPTHVDWSICYFSGDEMVVAEIVLTKYPQARHMTSPFNLKEPIIAVILRMKQANHRLALQTMTFVNYAGKSVETITIDDI